VPGVYMLIGANHSVGMMDDSGRQPEAV
jgi:hypothetical protein